MKTEGEVRKEKRNIRGETAENSGTNTIEIHGANEQNARIEHIMCN